VVDGFEMPQFCGPWDSVAEVSTSNFRLAFEVGDAASTGGCLVADNFWNRHTGGLAGLAGRSGVGTRPTPPTPPRPTQPTSDQVKQRAQRLLDGAAKPDLESAARIYSIGTDVFTTDPKFSPPPVGYVEKKETPPDGLDWGELHTHQTESKIPEFYDPKTGAGSMMTDIETTIRFWRMEGMVGENNFIRLNQGEVIVIDPNSRMIFQVRPPTKPGAKAAVPQPVPIHPSYFK
jgi:hypothetical protein